MALQEAVAATDVVTAPTVHGMGVLQDTEVAMGIIEKISTPMTLIPPEITDMHLVEATGMNAKDTEDKRIMATMITKMNTRHVPDATASHPAATPRVAPVVQHEVAVTTEQRDLLPGTTATAVGIRVAAQIRIPTLTVALVLAMDLILSVGTIPTAENILNVEIILSVEIILPGEIMLVVEIIRTGEIIPIGEITMTVETTGTGPLTRTAKVTWTILQNTGTDQGRLLVLQAHGTVPDRLQDHSCDRCIILYIYNTNRANLVHNRARKS